jgi:hypothetical protein
MHSSKHCFVSCMLSGMFGGKQHNVCNHDDVQMCGEMLQVYRLSLRFSGKLNSLNQCFPKFFAREPLFGF